MSARIAIRLTIPIAGVQTRSFFVVWCSVAHIRENWELQKSYLKRRSTFESIEFGIGLLELPEMERVRLGGRSVPAWYLTDYINLPDAHCGYALLEASEGEVDMLPRSTHSSL